MTVARGALTASSESANSVLAISMFITANTMGKLEFRFLMAMGHPDYFFHFFLTIFASFFDHKSAFFAVRSYELMSRIGTIAEFAIARGNPHKHRHFTPL